MDDIVERYGLPRKYVSCPVCGQVYGHHNTGVCSVCEECSTCCTCEDDDRDIESADQFVRNMDI
jgi:hypothetical protein